LELLLPFEDAGAGGGCLGLGDVAGALESNGKSSVGERVIGGEDREGHGGGDRVVELAGVAEGADETVMGLHVAGIVVNGGAKGRSCLSRLAGGEQVEGALGECVSVGG
jgi:hypothetical protein